MSRPLPRAVRRGRRVVVGLLVVSAVVGLVVVVVVVVAVLVRLVPLVVDALPSPTSLLPWRS